MKNTVNSYLGYFTTKNTKAIVIDAKTLLSSRALVDHGANPQNIIVINYDESIIRKAKKAGHIHSQAGISTDVLRNLDGKYDIIYLDYCGFPTRRSDGFDPNYDLLWTSDRLNNEGIVIATFSRRATDCIEKAESMIPLSMELVKSINYFETSAMFSMILTKGTNARCMRDTFNRIKVKRKREESQPEDEEPRPKVHRVEKHSNEAYVQRLKDKLPKRYGLVAYYHDGNLFHGVVDNLYNEFTKKRVKLLWVDTKDHTDYGSTKGIYPLNEHIDINKIHDKSDGNWAYLYDIYEKKTEEDIQELENVPISMSRKDYMQLKDQVLVKKTNKKFISLIKYF